MGYIFYFWRTSVTFSHFFPTWFTLFNQALPKCAGYPSLWRPLAGLCPVSCGCLGANPLPTSSAIYDFDDSFSRLVFSLPSVFDFDILLSFFLDKLALQQLRGTFLGSDELIQTCGPFFFQTLSCESSSSVENHQRICKHAPR